MFLCILVAQISGDRADDGNEGEDGAGEHADEEDSEVEVEEVSGYHFMDCMPLFVSYVYVTSGNAP
jgi:hypothetical protein